MFCLRYFLLSLSFLLHNYYFKQWKNSDNNNHAWEKCNYISWCPCSFFFFLLPFNIHCPFQPVILGTSILYYGGIGKSNESLRAIYHLDWLHIKSLITRVLTILSIYALRWKTSLSNFYRLMSKYIVKGLCSV